MASILRDSVNAIMRTCPRTIPLAMIALRRSFRGFPLLSLPYTGVVLRLATLQAATAPL